MEVVRRGSATGHSRWTRRLFLRKALAVGAMVAGAWILKRVFLPRSLRPSEVKTLRAFVDTLIGASPGPEAQGADLVSSIVRECDSDRRGRRALVEGVHMLDGAARRRGGTAFVALGRDEREEIVAALERAPEGSMARFFYRIVRDRAMRLHYARPAVWKALGVPHPPQPLGYRDYWRAPDV